MCWNEHVSLNTFLFSFGVLLLVMYNNAYTPYKIHSFTTPMYFFTASFIFIQLIEFFIWRNLHNAYNHLFSILCMLLIAAQPLISLSMVPDANLRALLMAAYAALTGGYVASHLTRNARCEKSKNGHLRWLFFESPAKISWVWLFFFLFSFVYNRMWRLVVFIVLSAAVSVYTSSADKTITSTWCWMANGVMLLLAVYLLVWLPYAEHGFCV